MCKDEGNSLTSKDDCKAGNRFNSTNSQVKAKSSRFGVQPYWEPIQFVDLSQEGQEWGKKICVQNHLFEIIMLLLGGEDIFKNILHILITPMVQMSTTLTRSYKHHKKSLHNKSLFTFQNIRLISSELQTFNNQKYYCFPFKATADIPGILLMERP